MDGAHYFTVTFKGRGRRERRERIPCSPGLAAFVIATVRERFAGKVVDLDAPLLVTAGGKRFTRNEISNLISRIAEAAGITRFRVSAHKVRHTMNVVARVGGVDMTQRSRLLGHSSPRSLARYEHLIPGELHHARAQQMAGLDRYVGGFGARADSGPDPQKDSEGNVRRGAH